MKFSIITVQICHCLMNFFLYMRHYATGTGVAFRWYSKNSPGKCSLLFRILNSAEMANIYNSVIYSEKPVEEPP